MMPSLLDTDILNEVLKQRNEAVVNRLANYHAQFEQLTFSRFSYYEVLRGLKEVAAVRQLQRFAVLCENSTILPLADEIIDRAVELWVDARRGGHPQNDADLIIAATAMHHGLVLVTGNQSHFDWILDLELDNWRGTTKQEND
jgi:predicted nucleic acid-binding protein